MRDDLELVWPGKGEHVLRNPQTGRWELCGSDPLPPGALVEIDTYGEATKSVPAGDNLLIKGENLYALQALRRTHAGRVKLIYVDPPFNTGQNFEAYDDNFQHSVWLSMMEERLALMADLLAVDGAIFVHIDQTELGNLLLLMRERFQERNFINIITVIRSGAVGHKAINPGVVNVCDFIVGFARDKKAWRPKALFRARSLDRAYDRWVENPDDSPSTWRITTLAGAFARHQGYASVRACRRATGEAYGGLLEKFVLENAGHVARYALPSYRGVSAAARALIDRSLEVRDQVFTLRRDGYSDMHFVNGQRLIFYETHKVQEIEGRRVTAERLTNVWDDLNFQGIAAEGGVTLKKGKKPEALVKRLLELCTDPGDLVLDCFAGSGTTGAAAHKMGRRWIMVDLERQVEELCLPRLKRVISGEDQTGISKAVGWKGGGGFRLVRAEWNARDLEILNRHADRLSREAEDVLAYQVAL